MKLISFIAMLTILMLIKLINLNAEEIEAKIIKTDQSAIELNVIKKDSVYVYGYRLASKSPTNRKSKINVRIKLDSIDTFIIPGRFNGVEPIIFGLGTSIGGYLAIESSSEKSQPLISGIFGALIGGLTYLFFEEVLEEKDIILTSINKYPHKLDKYLD